MWYRIERLRHVCHPSNIEHSDSPYWAHGKWFENMTVLDGAEARCRHCLSKLGDPNKCNFILPNIIVTYIQKSLQIPIQYLSLYIAKVDKRTNEFKDNVTSQ